MDPPRRGDNLHRPITYSKKDVAAYGKRPARELTEETLPSGSMYAPSQDTAALLQSTPVKEHEPRPKKKARFAPESTAHDTSSSEESVNAEEDDEVDLEDYSNPFQLAEETITNIVSRYEGQSQADEIRVASVLPSSAPSLNAPGMPPQRLTELDPTGLQDRDHQAAVLREALDRGIRPFIEVICENELACSTLRGAELENTLHEAYMATISVHREILDGLIDGTLVSKCADPSTEEAKIVTKFKDRTDAVSHPGIYQQGIATAEGVSPTTTEHKKALKDVYSYCFGKWHHDQAFAHAIDNIMEPHTSLADTRKGVRKYLRNHEDLPIEGRKQAASTFCKVFSAALDKVPTEHYDEPHKHILVEFGFSSHLKDRLRQHRKHESSNFLMNLYHACLMYRHGGKYILHQNVIALCARPQYATLLEILANRSGGGYVTSGWGLSHYPAGRSVPLGRRTVQQWADYFHWVQQHTPMEENHQAEVARIKRERRKEVDREDLKKRLRDTPLGSALTGLMEYMETQKHK
ncbi:hypothetical protein KC333_g6743 [Hortaea werneckii]|nr:hypothetical protein KC333_g6743 [Hortaea werneckii]KAI7310534.1 hypothetical protein KC326_g6646 [Hortaea werneckii]